MHPARASTSQKTYAGRFAVESVSGHGSMGAVYRAIDLTTDEVVALKVLFDGDRAPGADIVDRFDQEALLLADLKHPAIVRYIDHGVTTDGERYLAMEWLDGETVEDRLQRGALTMMEAAALGRRIVEALALAHRRGVVHRDVKPANLFLPDGDLERVKVLDFGIARRLFDGRRLTTPGSTLGTPMYMSPEQARGQTDIDARSDLFSLGCVLFECLSGQPPFIGETPMAVLAKICLDESVNIAARCPGLPRGIEDLLGRLLAKDREKRPADTTVLAAEMVGMVEQLAALGHEVPTPRRARVLTPQITEHEQRVFSAIMVSRPPGPSRALLDGWGITDPRELDRFNRSLDGFGARIERFYDGSLAATISGGGTPTDQSVRAARCALMMKALLPAATLAISTSRTQARGPLPVGGVLEGTARMLAGEKSGRIRIDDVTATLLAARFEMSAESGARYLLFEKGLREPPRTVLGRPVPCVGRDREIATLDGFWDEAINEPIARVVLVTGAAGGGKSRVRHEFLERVARRGQSFELLISAGDSMRTGGPYTMIGAALRGAANISGFEPLEVQRKRLAKHVTRRLPEKHARRVSSFLGEVTGIHFPDDDYPPLAAARHDPRVMADQTLAAWLDYIEAEVHHQPVLLVMEDLHWGDTPSVRLVDAALRVLREKALLVVAFARPEIDDRFAGLWDEHGLQRMHLAPLTSKACQKIARAVLGDEVGEERAAWITDRADGNPFFLEELLRASAEAGDTNAAQRVVEALPTTVLGVVQARFDALGNDGKRVLRAASIYGKTFRRDALLSLLGEKATHDLDTWLDVMEGRDIVIANDVAGTREFVFRHALLREAAYDTVTDADRTLGHRLAGEWLEKHGEQDAMVLVDHFERAALKKKAAEWCRAGAEQSLEANDLPAVLVRVERGIGNGADGEILGRLKLAEAHACNWRGEYLRAENSAVTAVDILKGHWFYLAERELLAAWGHQAKRSQSIDLTRPTEPACLQGWMTCVIEAAANEIFAGRLAAAESLLEQVVEKPHDPRVSPALDNVLALVARARGDIETAHSFHQSASAKWKRIGDERSSVIALGNCAAMLLDLGATDRADLLLEEVIGVSKRLSIDGFVVYATINRAQAAMNKSRFELAEALASDAAATGRSQREMRVVVQALNYVARARVAQGRTAEAWDAVTEAMESVQSLPQLQPLILAIRSDVARRRGELESACRDASDALEQLDRVDDTEGFGILTRVLCATTLIGGGDEARGTTALEAAWSMANAQLARIVDPELRASYCGIPENSAALSFERRLAAKEKEAL